MVLAKAESSYIDILRYDGTDWVNLPSLSVTNSCFTMKVDQTTGYPWLIIQGPTKVEAYYHDGTEWVQAGSEFGVGNAGREMDLEFHPVTNEPYVAMYADSSTPVSGMGMAISLWSFDGGWTIVGYECDKTYEVSFLDLEFSPSTYNPYISYNKRNGSDPKKVNVKTFDGTSWSHVGEPNMGSENTTYNELCFDGEGQLYLFYTVPGAEGVQLKKLVSGEWIDATDGTGTGYIPSDRLDLKVDPVSNKIWVATVHSTKMLMLNENSYLDVNDEWVFTDGAYYKPRLTFDTVNNVAYVAAKRLGDNKIIVKKLDIPNVLSNGQELENDNSWTLYPNPVSDELNISGISDDYQGDYVISNMLGQQVQQGYITSFNRSIPVMDLNSGTYFLTLVNEGVSKPFIVR